MRRQEMPARQKHCCVCDVFDKAIDPPASLFDHKSEEALLSSSKHDAAAAPPVCFIFVRMCGDMLQRVHWVSGVGQSGEREKQLPEARMISGNLTMYDLHYRVVYLSGLPCVEGFA